ncbi:MAG: phytanoyl-CoA dioxygenase family protein [Chloroflexota bacterium]
MTLSVDVAQKTDARYSLNRDEVAFYHANGYLGPFTAVSETEMAEIRDHIDTDILQRDGPNPRTRVQSRHMDSYIIYDLCTHPTIIDRMASIMGPDLIMWASNFFIKEPGGIEIPWHQDINFWPLEPPVNISAWVAIDNVTIENSCVQILPGSHKRMAPHIKAPEGVAFGQMIDPKFYDESKLINMELRPGRFFLFTERLMHHSNKNTSDQRRMGMSIRVTLPMVTINQDNPPLHKGHTAVLASGRDVMGFNRLAGRPVPR